MTSAEILEIIFISWLEQFFSITHMLLSYHSPLEIFCKGHANTRKATNISYQAWVGAETGKSTDYVELELQDLDCYCMILLNQVSRYKVSKPSNKLVWHATLGATFEPSSESSVCLPSRFCGRRCGCPLKILAKLCKIADSWVQLSLSLLSRKTVTS